MLIHTQTLTVGWVFTFSLMFSALNQKKTQHNTEFSSSANKNTICCVKMFIQVEMVKDEI